jgi:hypothetical protein
MKVEQWSLVLGGEDLDGISVVRIYWPMRTITASKRISDGCLKVTEACLKWRVAGESLWDGKGGPGWRTVSCCSSCQWRVQKCY